MTVVASGAITLIDLNDSKQLVSYIGASRAKTVIHNPNDNTYVPNYATANQVLTPQLFIAGTNTDVASQAKSTKWFRQTNSAGALTEITANGGGYALGTGAVKTLTINSNVLSSATTMTYICEMIFTDEDTGFDVITKSEIELVKVTNGLKGVDGLGAVTAILTNESHNIPTDHNGENGNYTNASTEMIIYEGTRNAGASWSVSATASSGVVGSLSGKVYTVTNMTVDDGYVDLVATRSGYDSITKRFVLSKTRHGVSGTTPTTYWLINDAHAIAKAKNGTYTPAKITVSGKSQTGTNAPANYSGRFRISESTDGTTFTAKYTSSANQATYTYPASGSLPSNLKAIKVELFRAGGTTSLLDEQVIPVIVDGTDGVDGVDSVIAMVWTPEGNTLKNSQGTLKANVTLYKGTTEVTPTAFKWYAQDPSATTSSGGDADGGNGWRLINTTWNAGVTGWNTATITIPASAIAGVESFKAIVTYGGKKYRDVCTVIDVTDPIVVTIIGMNVFKNGQGSTDLTAKLYREGAEIDSTGSDYSYSWSIYDSSNKKTPFSKTGKTITVSADDVDVRGNVICEVSNK